MRKPVLTMEDIKNNPYKRVLLTGITIDDPTGLHMTGSGKPLRWVVSIGGCDDWSMYCHWSDKSPEFVARSGDKVLGMNNILHVIDVDEEVQNHYRP